MNYQIRTLASTDFGEITRCFNTAFSDYLISVYASEKYLRTRWEVARVDYDLSFGAFANGQLVGFLIHGIDERDGLRTAHNTATGIEPPHRGQELLGKIYATALPALRRAGVEQSTLEVIATNERAIRAYQKVGFERLPERLHCFKGTLPADLNQPTHLNIRQVAQADWPRYQPLCQYAPTWEMTPEALAVNPSEFDFYELWKNGEFGGFLIHAARTGLVQQFAVRPTWRRQGCGTALFAVLRKESPHIRVVNVPEHAVPTLRFLEKLGLENHVDQFEMRLKLS